MMNDGGRANEPTSYGLRPPTPPQVPPQSSGYGPARAGSTQAVHAPAGRADPDVGRLIGGRYRLVSRLGHGGMGTVWRAHDEVVDRDVAVKEPRVPDHLGERERQNVYLRMQREARAAARVDHPSVVTMHDVVVEGEKPWIVMELVAGQSLGDRLQEGTLDVREAARIGADVLGALAAAHEAGVLHRDVKPDNVLLGRGGRVVLTDFGIAQVEGEQGLTETGAFVGSPEYIAPERVLGRRPGSESDLWSLGVVLYAAVEGMSPYRRSNTPATLQAVLSAEPQMPARGSGAFGTLVMQLLRKDPAMRPGSAEIRKTLESVARPPQAALDATRMWQRNGTTGGSGWVPPILRSSRTARFGLGGGLLAAALALVLIIANPFGGDELPESWKVRTETELLAADIAVPEDYRRVQSDTTDDFSVTYYDPSGVFTVYLARVPGSKDLGDVGKEAEEWVSYYRAGGESETTIQDVKSTAKPAKQQGKEARDVVTSYRDYSADEDDLYKRYQERYYVNGKKSAYWRLQVSMPDRGAAAKDGEQLFDTIVKHLEIQDL
ncbi:serine/threonine-protein kinase [Streptomyces sp. H27-C3]|uniref:serine/threonine-protein kinase n=1 Tax=Streptomyces sp. H27-C3 TaxID=3046305 RepID=UPI0024B9136E|nr:serine/threonine-protein kinase [Streptomyces sp. H27-C3]MDJ0466472.1 serine/threonine-protein kinase [Streptomyces sp. H27-C3]